MTINRHMADQKHVGYVENDVSWSTKMQISRFPVDMVLLQPVSKLKTNLTFGDRFQ